MKTGVSTGCDEKNQDGGHDSLTETLSIFYVMHIKQSFSCTAVVATILAFLTSWILGRRRLAPFCSADRSSAIVQMGNHL